MKHNMHVTPGRLVATQARVGIVLGVLFLLFGLVLAVVVGMESSASEPGLLIAQLGFLLIWIAGCVGIIIFYARLLSSQRSPSQNALLDVHVDEATPPADIEGRLRQLERLRREGLITDAEYQTKRDQIMQERW